MFGQARTPAAARTLAALVTAAVVLVAISLVPAPATAAPATLTVGGASVSLSENVVSPGDTLTIDVTFTNLTSVFIDRATVAIRVDDPALPPTFQVEHCDAAAPGDRCHSLPERPVARGFYFYAVQPGETRSGQLIVTITEHAVTFPLTVAVSHDTSPEVSGSHEVTVVYGADLGLAATVVTAGPRAQRFVVTATNHGPGALTGATITAPLPAGLHGAGQPSSPSCSYNTAARTWTCSVGALNAGESAQLTFGVAPTRWGWFGSATVTLRRSASVPVDPNPANDHVTARCGAFLVVFFGCRT